MIGWIAFWTALTVLFGVVEGFSRTWYALPFALAAATSGAAATFGAPVATQCGVYAVAALVFLFVGRRLVVRLVGKR